MWLNQLSAILHLRRVGRPLAFALLAGLLWAAGALALPALPLFAQAGGPTTHDAFFPQAEGHGALFPQASPNAQVFNDDLVVSGSDFYVGDVVVYNGDVRVEAGGRIGGSLYVFSGDVELRTGGAVGGDVIAYGGDVQLYDGGQVQGGVQALGGDVTLRDGSAVGGDVSVLGGNIERSAGARVGGNVLSGPRTPDLPELPLWPGLPPFSANGMVPPALGGDGSTPLGPGSFARWFWNLVLDLVRATFFTLVVILAVMAVARVRPEMLSRAVANLEADPRSSFGIGLLANLLVLIPLWMWLGSLSASWVLALCLSPLLLPLGLAALALEAAGLAVTGRWLGGRIVAEAHVAWPTWAFTLLGSLLLVGGSALLWVFTPCLGWLALLFAGAPGLGALILHWREGRSVPGVSQSILAWEPPMRPPAQPPVQSSVQSAAPAPDAAPVPPAGDADFDFTTLGGIGPVFSMRLRAANVRTLADLAAMSPEALADVLTVSVERILRDDILGQARRLLEK